MNADPETNPLLTFHEAEQHALALGRRMTLPERIRWLEDAEETGVMLQAARWKAGLRVDPRLERIMEKRFGSQRASTTGRAAEAAAPYGAPPSGRADSRPR